MMYKMFTKLSNLQWRQILTTASVNYIMVCVGMSLVWTSPVLRELRGPDSPLARPPTSGEQGWMGSLILLGGFFGPILTVPLTRVIGRRWIILTMGIPHILGWVVAGVATTIYHMFAARFLWGCTLGIAFMMVPIYVGEIAEDSIRGALGAMFSQALNVGFFMGYFVGRFTNYWGLAATGGVLSLFYLVLAWTLPETPLYLVYKGHSAEASVVLQKLRNASEEAVSAELKSLESAVENEYKYQPKISDLWASTGSLKALAICVFLSVMIQLSGINVLLFYLEELFARIKVGMSPADASILIGVVQTISSSITPFIIERLGRRLLLYTTLFGMAIALSVIGIYTVMESYYNHDMTSFSFLPVLCVIVYIILFSSGIGPMPPILISEMFRPKVKCLASAICSSCNWIAGFILTRFYTNLTDAGGTYTGFWLLAVFCTIGSLFSFLFLPETKGKSFDEIQDLLENRTSDKKTGE